MTLDLVAKGKVRAGKGASGLVELFAEGAIALEPQFRMHRRA